MMGVLTFVILLIFILGLFCNYIRKTYIGTQKLKVFCIPLLITGDINFQSSSHLNLSSWIALPLSEQANSLNSYFSSSLQNGDTDNEMRYEWLRLRSYSTFPLTSSSQSPVRLARSGFYFTGRNQECVCFSCGVHNSNWTRQNVTELHRQLSPDCRHVRGTNDTNVQIGSIESCQSNNLHTESTSSVAFEHVASALQRSHRPQMQQTGSCNASAQTHTNHRDQPSSSSQPNRLKETLEPLGIVIDRPRYPSYAVLATRVSSFQQWPSHMAQTPRDLSLAGFFYVGYGDYVRCFFCGGGLRNWEPGDDAWVEHARWFSKCPFLIQNRGLDFVRLVQSIQEEDSESQPSQDQNENSGDIEQLPAACEIYQMGYTWETIKETYRKLNKKEEDVTTAELIEEILASDSAAPSVNVPQDQNSSASTAVSNGNDTNRASNSLSTFGLSEELGAMSLNDETQSLVDENKRLKEQRLCRICMEEDVSIAFLPCGHLCCCSHCAPAMRKCPICRAFIKGTVKTYPA